MSKSLENKGKKPPGLEQAVELMKALSHPVRLSILCNLIHWGEMTAGEIVDSEKNNASQSQVSQYLGILRDLDYVAARREGQVVYYTIRNKTVKKIVEDLYNTYCGDKKKGKDSCLT